MNSLLIKMAARYAIQRLKEPSTWAAIAAGLSGYIHVALNRDFTNAFIAAGLAFSAMLGIVLKEGISK